MVDSGEKVAFTLCLPLTLRKKGFDPPQDKVIIGNLLVNRVLRVQP